MGRLGGYTRVHDDSVLGWTGPMAATRKKSKTRPSQQELLKATPHRNERELRSDEVGVREEENDDDDEPEEGRTDRWAFHSPSRARL